MAYGQPTSAQYRYEAERLRQQAAALADNHELRERYLSLVRDYERLAKELEEEAERS
jgi:hypothetical protein